jgi:predicted amidohydrolase
VADQPVVRAAAVQMTSGTSVRDNLSVAAELIQQAVTAGANLIVLPENFSFLGATDAERIAAAEIEGTGQAQDFLKNNAAKHAIWIVGGTIPILASTGRAHSRSLVVDSRGAVAAAYDKIHLFDVDVPHADGEHYRESRTTVAGQTAVVAETTLGALGIAVCYDLRFPALFHRLGMLGMEILALPAAFTVPTGLVHWLPLLSARAIESLSYVVASAQWGEHGGGRKTYGHSMIIDPWGTVLAECKEGAGIAVADLDMMRLVELRRQFPSLTHRREL